MTTRENVIDRIAKLLALSEGAGASPHEAATAAATAQRLMEQYQIDQAELGALDEEAVRDDHEPLYAAEGALPSWLGALADVVTRANGCRAWIHTVRFRTKGTRGRVASRNALSLVGRKSDVQVARYLFVFCRREVERLVADCRRAGLIRGRTAITNFRAGCVAAIREKLAETREQAREGASSTAIVRLDQRDQAVAQVLDSMGLRQRIVRHTRDLEAWTLGRQAGRSIDIRPGVEGHEAPKQVGKGGCAV